MDCKQTYFLCLCWQFLPIRTDSIQQWHVIHSNYGEYFLQLPSRKWHEVKKWNAQAIKTCWMKRKTVAHPCVSGVILFSILPPSYPAHLGTQVSESCLQLKITLAEQLTDSWCYHEILTLREIIFLNKLQWLLCNGKEISWKCQSVVLATRYLKKYIERGSSY